jgi:hypothetical protein
MNDETAFREKYIYIPTLSSYHLIRQGEDNIMPVCCVFLIITFEPTD